MVSLGKTPGIMPALDVDLPAARKLVASLQGVKGSITGLKIGSLLVMKHGLSEVCKSLDSGIPLVLDMQKHGTDIPNIIGRQVELAAEEGIAAYIGSPLGAGATSDEQTSGSLEMFVSSCKAAEILPIVVLEMTQPGSTYFLRPNACEDLASIICDLGVEHVVAPATRPERIEVYRNIFAKNGCAIEVISPGVGPQKTGDPIKDAVEAVKCGADHLVIGRAIYTSPDPESIVRDVSEAIRSVRLEGGESH